MGNCWTNTDIVCRHELLNEHNERYFAKVEARNSTQTTRRWWERRKTEQEKSLSKIIVKEENETDDGKTKLMAEEYLTASSFPILNDNRHSFSNFEPEFWPEVRNRSTAFELRREEYSRLQVTSASVPARKEKNMSPITFKTDTTSTTEPFSLFDDWGETEALNDEFEITKSEGVVWSQITCASCITAVAVYPNHSIGYPLLAIGTEDGSIYLKTVFDIAHPTEDANSLSGLPQNLSSSLQAQAHCRVRSLHFSPDGLFLIVGGDGCVAVILQVVCTSPDDRMILQTVSRLHSDDRIYAVRFNPRTATVAMGGFDGKVSFFQLDEEVSLSNLCAELIRPGLIYCLDWNHNGRLLAFGGSDKSCVVVDDSFSTVYETQRSSSIRTVSWSRSGKKLAIGDTGIVILDQAKNFDVVFECESLRLTSKDYSRYEVTAACWSKDDTFLAIGGSDGMCLILETKDYVVVHEIQRPNTITCLSWGEHNLDDSEWKQFLALSDGSFNLIVYKVGSQNDRRNQGFLADH